jgi:hypothetical protein
MMALTLTLVACGSDAEEYDLCVQYDDLQAAVVQVEELDPETASASDMLAIVEDVIVELDQLQAASDALYDQAVSNFNLALEDLRQVTFDVGAESLVVARPLIEESLTATAAAYEVLKQRLDVACDTN